MVAIRLATVVGVQEAGPSFRRFTFDGCTGMASGGKDQRIKILLAGPGQRIKILLAGPGQSFPHLPDADDWYNSYRSMPDAVRPTMRTFTIRSQDGDRVDIEFALHGDAGPASAWARAARPGSMLGIIGPGTDDTVKAMQYAPPADASWQLLVGDETAVPAVAAILETLPAGVPVRVFLQVPTPADVRDLGTPVSWSFGGGLADAVAAAELPGGVPYAWVAGESGVVRAIRRHLCDGLGWDAKAHYFGGYWKAGQAEPS